ncbi:coenzyme PQQ synthesis protein D (PqqD) [Roseovarius mucosus]|uniref:Coenzyme PQQ synthesis protein D (PqqD) n=1 Tax=Roseovarius mucosus TaxID=215743 RepID=A0A1V0RJF2_9RHOB|nr:PqqD family peptide modification chaperone [Roseovarius mucosus]ARE81919.1 coenzyme PQQ synthesis protein D (PqqD) [Roseovarius mucosus]
MRAMLHPVRQFAARLRAASDSAECLLRFDTVPQEVVLGRAEAVAGALSEVMPGWGCRSLPGAPSEAVPVTRVTAEDSGRYSYQSWWSRAPLTDLGLAGATCGVVADLVQSYCDARPEMIGLHCGAVEVGGHLLAFTGPYRAGKTTLVTRLAAEPGVRLYCDDVLPVNPDGQGVALGVQPRLRLPLPEGVSDGFRVYVADHLTVQDRRYGYVRCDGQAPLGTQAPLAGLIVLRREASGPARLHRMRVADAVAHMIRQNIADPGETEAHYDRLAALGAQLFCATLVYSDLEEAVQVVRDLCAAPELPGSGVQIGPMLPPDPVEAETVPADLAQVFCRAEEVSAREIGQDVFLWQMAGRNFFRLNPVAGAVWALLEEPCYGHDIAETLAEVFVGTPQTMIADDLSDLLGQMCARGLVRAEG